MQRIHSESEEGKVMIYTTSDNVLEQYKHPSLVGLEFIDIKGAKVFLPKERIIRILEFNESGKVTHEENKK